MRPTLFRAALYLSAVTATPMAKAAEQTSAYSKSQTVELGENRYRFPAYALVRYFGKPVPDAVEVNLLNSFWASIFQKVAPISGWMSFENGALGLHYITKPNDLFQWRPDRKWPLPPVRGPVELADVRDGMRVWKSLDPEIAREGLIYITFDGRSDLYGECTERDLRSSEHYCKVWLFDKGVIHGLGVAGDWITHAPAAADEYLRVVKVR